MRRWLFNWILITFLSFVGHFQVISTWQPGLVHYSLVLEKRFENPAAGKPRLLKSSFPQRLSEVLLGTIYKENLFSLWTLQISFVYFSLLIFLLLPCPTWQEHRSTCPYTEVPFQQRTEVCSFSHKRSCINLTLQVNPQPSWGGVFLIFKNHRNDLLGPSCIFLSSY